MILDNEKLQKLNIFGLNFDGHTRDIPDDFQCEVPCSLKTTFIGPKVTIGAFSYMVSGYLFATTIGRYCSIAEEVQIGRQDHPINWVSTSPYLYIPSKDIQPHSPRLSHLFKNDYYLHGKAPTVMQHTTIGHNVWIGHGAIIKAGISIGNGAIIASGSIVTKNVAPYTIVGGNPAKFIRYRIDETIIQKLEETKWWEYSPKQLEVFQIHDIQKFIDEFNPQILEKPLIHELHLNNFNF